MLAIEYENKIEDIVEFNKYAVRHRARWMMVKQQCIVGLIFGCLAYILLHKEPWVGGSVGLIAFLLAAALLPSIQYASLASNIKSLAKKDPPSAGLGKHRLEVMTDGLREISDFDETFRSWDKVQGITEAKKHVFVWVALLKAYVIPKKQVNQDELSMFISSIQGHLEK